MALVWLLLVAWVPATVERIPRIAATFVITRIPPINSMIRGGSTIAERIFGWLMPGPALRNRSLRVMIGMIAIRNGLRMALASRLFPIAPARSTTVIGTTMFG